MIIGVPTVGAGTMVITIAERGTKGIIVDTILECQVLDLLQRGEILILPHTRSNYN